MRRRRRVLPRRRVAQSLEQGRCMFSVFGPCVGDVTPAPLVDGDAVLVCAKHRHALAELRQHHREVVTLRRYLRRAFGVAA